MFRILEEGFTPTVEDILRSRVRTTGIVELGFRLNFDKRELNFQVKFLNSNVQFCCCFHRVLRGRDEIGGVYLPSQLERTQQLFT